MAKAELIKPPPPTLQDKVGARAAGFDAEAVARAEQALREMSGNFHTWMAEDIGRLEKARRSARAAGFNAASVESLYGHAHDVKGLGGTYDYPLCTLVAGSLCRLLDTPEARAAAPANAALIEACVDALRAIVRERAQDINNPVGQALAATLRGHVEDLFGPE